MSTISISENIFVLITRRWGFSKIIFSEKCIFFQMTFILRVPWSARKILKSKIRKIEKSQNRKCENSKIENSKIENSKIEYSKSSTIKKQNYYKIYLSKFFCLNFLGRSFI